MELECIFPALKECSVSIATEKGDSWGGLEICGFTESELEKDIHTVVVNLYWFYDEDGNPCDGYRDDTLYDISFMDGSIYGGKIDPKEGTYWFVSYSDAVKFADKLYSEMVQLGYTPLKYYE